MRRRLEAPLTGLVAFCLTVWGCGQRTGEVSPVGRNVILITLDTLRPDHVGCYGHPDVRTPNLDRLAARSIQFTEAVAVVPTTLASHLSILTGTDPRTHGIPRNGFRVDEGNLTLAEVLKEHGYVTAAFVSAFSLDRRFNLAQGFDFYDCAYDRAITPEKADQAQRRAAATTDAVLRWLADYRDERFFLWVHYFDPHYPYDPPDPYGGLYDPDYDGPADGSMAYLERVWLERVVPTEADRRYVISLYDGEISYMDEHLGRLLEEFDRSGLAEHSIVVVVADHGESLGEHDYHFDHGQYVYDASIRVPLLLHCRSLYPRGRVVTEQVDILDLMPTILDLLDLAIPDLVEGRSLGPLIEGDPAWSERVVFSEASKPWNVGTDSGATFQNDPKAKCARTREWKLVDTPFVGIRELYYLPEDPRETVNLIASKPAVAEALGKHLDEWLTRPRTRFPAKDLTPDPDTLEKLRSLGYIH